VSSGLPGFFDVAKLRFDCTGFRFSRDWRGLAAALGAASVFVAAFGLLEEGGEDAGEGDEKADDEESKGHRAPQRGVARGAGLLGDVAVGDAAGDEGEEDKSAGEDVEVAAHADGSILAGWAYGAEGFGSVEVSTLQNVQ
jgi:hypothetical protein